MGKSSKRNRRKQSNSATGPDDKGYRFTELDLAAMDWVGCVGAFVIFEGLSRPEFDMQWFVIAHFDQSKNRLIVVVPSETRDPVRHIHANHSNLDHLSHHDLTYKSFPVARVYGVKYTADHDEKDPVISPHTVPLQMANSAEAFAKAGLDRASVWCVPTVTHPALRSCQGASKGIHEATFQRCVQQDSSLREYELVRGWDLLGSFVPHDIRVPLDGGGQGQNVPGVIHAYPILMLSHKLTGAILDINPRSDIAIRPDCQNTRGMIPMQNIPRRLFIRDPLQDKFFAYYGRLQCYVQSAIQCGLLPIIHRSIDAQGIEGIIPDRFAHFEPSNTLATIECFHDTGIQPAQLTSWQAKQDMHNWMLYRPSSMATPPLNKVILSRALAEKIFDSIETKIKLFENRDGTMCSVGAFHCEDAWADQSVCARCDVRSMQYVECEGCGKFRYCTAACRHLDRDAHAKVCPTPERIAQRKKALADAEAERAAADREQYERTARIARQRAQAAANRAREVEARIRAAAPGPSHRARQPGAGARAAQRTTEEQLVHDRWDSAAERQARRDANEIKQAQEHAERLAREASRREELVKRVKSEADKEIAVREQRLPTPRSISAVVEEALMR